MFESRFEPAILDHLTSIGYTHDLLPPFTNAVGGAHAIHRTPHNTYLGAADPRRDGFAPRSTELPSSLPLSRIEGGAMPKGTTLERGMPVGATLVVALTVIGRGRFQTCPARGGMPSPFSRRNH